MKDEKKFETLFRLLDSEQPGERQTALEKIHALRAEAGWPSFGAVWGALENNAPRAEFDTLKAELAKWIAAHDALVQDKETLTEENAALRAKLRAIVRVPRAAAIAAAVIGAAWFGYGQFAVSGVPTVARAPAAAAETLPDAMGTVLRGFNWEQGNGQLAIRTVAAVPYWVFVRSEVDAKSHVDDAGIFVTRYCLHLFASKATPDAGSYLTPEPFNMFGKISWPELATECRLPGPRLAAKGKSP